MPGGRLCSDRCSARLAASIKGPQPSLAKGEVDTVPRPAARAGGGGRWVKLEEADVSWPGPTHSRPRRPTYVRKYSRSSKTGHRGRSRISRTPKTSCSERGCSFGTRPVLKIEDPVERTETGGEGSIAFSYVLAVGVLQECSARTYVRTYEYVLAATTRLDKDSSACSRAGRHRAPLADPIRNFHDFVLWKRPAGRTTGAC